MKTKSCHVYQQNVKKLLYSARIKRWIKEFNSDFNKNCEKKSLRVIREDHVAGISDPSRSGRTVEADYLMLVNEASCLGMTLCETIDTSNKPS